MTSDKAQQERRAEHLDREAQIFRDAALIVESPRLQAALQKLAADKSARAARLRSALSQQQMGKEIAS